MSSVPRVPEGGPDSGGRVTAQETWAGLRADGPRTVGGEVLARFRYGDGFSSARALAFQLALAALPLVIAVIGLAGAWEAASVRLVLSRTVLQLTPAPPTRCCAARSRRATRRWPRPPCCWRRPRR